MITISSDSLSLFLCLTIYHFFVLPQKFNLSIYRWNSLPFSLGLGLYDFSIIIVIIIIVTNNPTESQWELCVYECPSSTIYNRLASTRTCIVLSDFTRMCVYNTRTVYKNVMYIIRVCVCVCVCVSMMHISYYVLRNKRERGKEKDKTRKRTHR